MSFNIFHAIDGESYERTYKASDLRRRIASYLAPNSGVIATASAATVALALTGGGAAIATAQAVDSFKAGASLTISLAWAVAVTLLGVGTWLSNSLLRRVLALVTAAVAQRIRCDLFSALLRQDLAFFDAQKSGALTSRVMTDTNDFTALAQLVSDLIAHILLIMLLSSTLFFIDPGLAVLALAVAPTFILTSLVFRRLARNTGRAVQRRSAEIAAVVHETIEGIAVARSFRRETAMSQSFDLLTQRAYDVGARQGRVQHAIYPVLDMLAGGWLALVLYAGGVRVLSGEITVGSWFLFLQIIFIFHLPLTAVASFWSIFQRGISAAERIFALIDMQPNLRQIACDPLADLQGRIDIENVSFSYHPGKIVLDKFSLSIQPGEKVALVGTTGAGKSSVIRMVARLYEFDAGDLRIDGRDIRRLNLSDYRRQIGLVPQVPVLFKGTVADNIGYGRPNATEAEVAAAACAVADGEWLRHLADGLMTQVGERGSLLSVGQRQLVALARIVLQNPALLLLDEATANIDPVTESLLREGLEQAAKGRTSIIVAHRLSTVLSADWIVVMDHGSIVEQGRHNELLARNGAYAALSQAYFGQ